MTPIEQPPIDAEWRKIPNHPGFEVSEYGHVRRRLPSGDFRVLRQWKTKAGRWQAHLWHNGKVSRYNSYRLVAICFLGPPPFDGALVGHIDDNKDHNHHSNLVWCTHAENAAQAVINNRSPRGQRNGAYTQPHRRRRGELNGLSKLTENEVRVILDSSASSGVMAARFGVSSTTVKAIRRGKMWAHVPRRAA